MPKLKAVARSKTVQVMSLREARKVFYIPRGIGLPEADSDGDFQLPALAARFPTWAEAKAVWPDFPRHQPFDWRDFSKDDILRILASDRRLACWERLELLLEELGLNCEEAGRDAYRNIDLDDQGRVETVEELAKAIARHPDLLDVLTAPAARTFAMAVLKYPCLAGLLVASRL